MSSRIEALCILVLCLFGMWCSSIGVEDFMRTVSDRFVIQIPGVQVGIVVLNRKSEVGSREPE